MELKNEQMSDLIEDNGFRDIDVTNWSELVATLILSIIANILLFIIFQRIQNLFIWKKEDPKNNPSKMLSVNCLLVITILFKIFSLYYSIAGFFFSQFWNWKCDERNTLTISPSFYIIIQICQAQTLNFIFCFCSNLWLKLWRMKLRIDQNKKLLSLTKILQIYLSILIVTIPILTLVSLILGIYIIVQSKIIYLQYRKTEFLLVLRKFYQLLIQKKNQIKNKTDIIKNCNIREYVLGALTLLSTFSFAFIILILYSKLKDQYSVGDHYRSRLKYLLIGIIICALFRPTFNFLFSQNFFWKLKSGKICNDNEEIYTLPDQGINWAIFQFFYSSINDFIPICILSLLFSPNLSRRKTLVNVSDGWDSNLE